MGSGSVQLTLLGSIPVYWKGVTIICKKSLQSTLLLRQHYANFYIPFHCINLQLKIDTAICDRNRRGERWDEMQPLLYVCSTYTRFTYWSATYHHFVIWWQISGWQTSNVNFKSRHIQHNYRKSKTDGQIWAGCSESKSKNSL